MEPRNELPEVYDPSFHQPSEPEPPVGFSPGSDPRPLTGHKAALVGGVIGVVVFVIPFLRFVFSYLNILAHELGHTVAAWAFGYPAVPAFDWRYGGGVTLSSERSVPVFLICWAALASLIYLNRETPRFRNLFLIVAAIYGVAAFTDLHRIFELAMGHLTELCLAGIFLFRALTGRSVVHSVERPLYAACGVFMILGNLSLSWGLMTDVDARAAYGMAKGGGHWMDLDRLAIDYLGLGLPAVAFFLFAACWATPVAAYRIASRFGSAEPTGPFA